MVMELQPDCEGEIKRMGSTKQLLSLILEDVDAIDQVGHAFTYVYPHTHV